MGYEFKLSCDDVKRIDLALKCAVRSSRREASEAIENPKLEPAVVSHLFNRYMTIRETFEWWERLSTGSYRKDQ